MDISKRFPHYTPAIRELLERSYTVAALWKQKPRKNAKAYESWEKNFYKHLDGMSETMVLFGLSEESTDAGSSKKSS